MNRLLKLSPLALATACVLAQAQTLPPLNSDNSRSSTPSALEQARFGAALAQVSSIEIKADRNGIPANGRDAIVLTIRVLDRAGNPVVGDVPLTLEASRGRFVELTAQDPLAAAVDREFAVAGNQVVAKNGELQIKLQSPGEPGDGQVRVSAGTRQATLDVSFVPDLREMIAVGIVEGIINFNRNKGGNVILPNRPSDGFEQELRNLSREFNDGKGVAAGRLAFFLKGRIKGETLLTAAYDSDKDVRDRLFRDIQPDEFYPVYGDASLKGFDAQSGSRLYVRLDNGKNYLLWGDFQTTDINPNEASQLGRYTRSLTGAQTQWTMTSGQGDQATEVGRFKLFAAKDNLRQVVDEIPGRGISGPYTLRYPNGLAGSERVELIVRDRNAPTIILRVTPLVRFVDYDFEPFSGRLLFTAPVPSVDERLNPISIRATYEVEDGGEKYWVWGYEANAQVTSNLALGATFAQDKNPFARYKLGSVNGALRLGESTTLVAEVAKSVGQAVTNFGFTPDPAANPTGPTITSGPAEGKAARVEMRHDSNNLQARVYGQHSQAGFNNPGASLGLGVGSARTEAGGKATYRLNERLSVTGEALGQRDNLTDGERRGAYGGVIWDVSPAITAEVGLRHARQTGAGATLPATGAAGLLPGTSINPVNGGSVLDPAGTVTAGNEPYNNNSVRGKFTWRPNERASVFVEAEKGFGSNDEDGHALALGGEYRFDAPGSLTGRLYGRTEWTSGLGGDYGISGNNGRQSATVVGVDTPYMKDGQLFSEYRLRDALGGREAVAAAGLRNVWRISEGWRMSTAFERVKVLDGAAQEGKAVALGLDYVGSDIWKGSTRAEWREDEDTTSSATTTSWLHSIAVARKLSDDWTILARNLFLKRDSDGALVIPGTPTGGIGGGTGGGTTGTTSNTALDSIENRFQIGAAWRETQTNVWSAFGRYEYWLQKYGQGSGADDIRKHIASVDATYHPSRPWWFFGKVAGKWTDERIACITDPATGITSNCVDTSFDGQLLQGRLIYDITPRWDVGVMASVLGESGFKSRRYAYGVELGYLMMDNLWLSAGFNHKGFTDRDLSQEATQQGFYLRLRFKFDEKIFQRDKRDLDRSVEREVKP
jgi:hypothetical protein